MYVLYKNVQRNYMRKNRRLEQLKCFSSLNSLYKKRSAPFCFFGTYSAFCVVMITTLLHDHTFDTETTELSISCEKSLSACLKVTVETSTNFFLLFLKVGARRGVRSFQCVVIHLEHLLGVFSGYRVNKTGGK